jgi:hypothetical protein
MEVSSEQETLNLVSDVLSSIYPPLKPENDICGVRAVVGAEGAARRATGANTGPDHRATRLPSILVTLSSSELTRSVLRARNGFTRFNTRDITRKFLDPEVELPNSRVFVNEALSRDEHRCFTGLKEIAKGLGFKYFWHRAGLFLARRKSGERVHVIKTAADLGAIVRACGVGRMAGPPDSSAGMQVVQSTAPPSGRASGAY